VNDQETTLAERRDSDLPDASRHVGKGMRRALRAVAEAIFSGDAGPAPSERIDWLMSDAEDFLVRAGSQTRLVMRLSLLAISLVAPILVLRLPPFRTLPLRERARALARFERSKFGAPLLAVKALVTLLYYEHPDAAREAGFDGVCARPVPRALP
jgi:hypothetical protein